MKYFIVSDIHSFCEELKYSLKKAGFNKRNKEHILIVCGDVFDRGPDTVGVYKFLTSIPKKRCILIKGNHESLFKELLTKPFPHRHDFSNGTVSAFCQIAGVDEEKLNKYYWFEQGFSYGEDYDTIEEKLYSTWNLIKTLVAKHPITTWLESPQWKNYYETSKYVFVHSFIPVALKEEYSSLAGLYNLKPSAYSFREDWRNASDEDWEEATWKDPIAFYQGKLFNPEVLKNKVLVCGHWHTSDFYSRINGIPTNTQKIYYSTNLIGIDGGVTRTLYGGMSHPQNVLIIDSEDFNKCYDQEGVKLSYIDSL